MTGARPPIAITGRACLLPGANDPAALWRLVRDGRSALSDAPSGRWRVDRATVAHQPGTPPEDHTWSTRGGYVTGFDGLFDPTGFGLGADRIAGLDPLHRWVLHTAREALRDAGLDDGRQGSTGLIIGNLSYPTAALNRLAEATWLGELAPRIGLDRPDPINRFSSGLPALLTRRALGFGGPCHALDAACASSLYAIDRACAALADRRADRMLAGGVNCTDDLFIHIGFCALRAMSPTGRSRPFHRDADGLVPAEGAGLLTLERLDDALARGAHIHGIIRGVGLSNDGRAKGLLAPSADGQIRAMQAAYAGCALDPGAIHYVECHATGTPVGDGVEVGSLSAIFGEARRGRDPLPIGSIKSNLGHPITASGAAGLIKLLAAFEAGELPPSIGVDDRPLGALADSPLRVVQAAEPWPADGPRRAAICNFGFGGNNAHLIVEQWRGRTPQVAQPPRRPQPRPEPLAIVGVAVLAAGGSGRDDFAADLRLDRPRVRPGPDGLGGRWDEITLPLRDLRFPPVDLKQTLPQQLGLLQATFQLLDGAPPLDGTRTGVFVGMQCDAEIARCGARWRKATWMAQLADADADPAALDAWSAAADAAFDVLRGAPGVVGAMPNIVANRISSQFDLQGPGLAFSAEELSGIRALDAARDALNAGHIDAAFVGAVDLCCEAVHRAAAAGALDDDRQIPGDAAVMLRVMRLSDARRDGHPIRAVLPADGPERRDPRTTQRHVARLWGHAHAATGLMQLAAAIELLGAEHPALMVEVHSPLGGDRATLHLRAPDVAPPPRTTRTIAGPSLRFPAHPPRVALPALPLTAPTAAPSQPAETAMPQPPAPTHAMPPAPPRPAPTHEPALMDFGPATPQPAAQPATPAPPRPAAQPATGHPLLTRVLESHRRMVQTHQAVIGDQHAGHRAFLDRRARITARLMALGLGDGANPPMAPESLPMAPEPSPMASEPSPMAPEPSLITSEPPPMATEPSPMASEPPADAMPQASPAAPAAPEPTGPTFDRAQLEQLASGRISAVFGETFAVQDTMRRQVRMPEPPLLLAHRVTGIDAEPGTMGTGTLWTETDVARDDWFLHDDAMPAGILVESGQADLLLISWLGIDLAQARAGVSDADTRVYRLLGCELTFHGGLPRPGETLVYDIHIDRHVQAGAVRLFFFHYDCRVDGQLRLSVRNGQAGFFTDRELIESKGILWTPEETPALADRRLDPPPQLSTRRSFTAAQVEAFAAGRVDDCFGPGFERARTHTRTPRIQSGPMGLLQEVSAFDPTGGHWGRGYLRVDCDVTPDDWFFKGHFKNDPCMPGTLMCEGCNQGMAFYLAALGFTLDRDGWRFEPVAELCATLRCRGQVTPKSKKLTYEVFVQEVIGGPEPTLIADVLGTADGLALFHGHQMGIRLVPDYPLDRLPDLVAAAQADPRPVFEFEGHRFDYASLLACAWGRPSDAFGPRARAFDGHRSIARLPGPPYHFISRVIDVDGPMGEMKAGLTATLAYDVPPDGWYFAASAHPEEMPFAVLLEAALQPCGWLAVYVGCPMSSATDLYFRNLDGTATVHRPVAPTDGTLMTRAKLTRLTRAGSMILVSFEVAVHSDAGPVLTMDTTFGFFTHAALQDQAGLGTSEAQTQAMAAPCDGNLAGEPLPVQTASLPSDGLPSGMLGLIDRITGVWPATAEAPARIRGEMDIEPGQWFFAAHFHGDPVQPGSIGLELMIALLQHHMMHVMTLDDDMANPRCVTLDRGRPMTWSYRGQVRPHNKRVVVELEITESGRDADGPYAIAGGSLWVDGMRIYKADGIGMRVVDEAIEPPSADPAHIDGTRRVMAHLGERLGPDDLGTRWLGALCAQYLGAVELEDPPGFAAHAGKPAIYLANHQVQIESMLVGQAIAALSGTDVETIADARHRGRWLGALDTLGESHAPEAHPQRVIYFEQSDPGSMSHILDGLRGAIERGHSVFLHPQGALGLSCRTPVNRLSSVFVDLAIERGVPIVPIRIRGGLPVAPLAETRDWPFAHGRQSVVIGPALSAEALAAKPYGERRAAVLAAINAVGGGNAAEQPAAPDPDFCRRVEQAKARTGGREAPAVMLAALDRWARRTPDVIAVLASDDPSPSDGLVDRVRRWLYAGEHPGLPE